MKKKIKVLIIPILVSLFIILHITPHNAVRTYIFLTGHPKIAFTSEIDIDIIHRDLETENVHFYVVNNPPIDNITKNDLTSYKVTKKFFLFFAKYYGEA